MLPDNGKKVKQYHNYHIRPDELKVYFKYIRMRSAMKYEIASLLMATRGMRPQEALAVNIRDFNDDFTKLTFREAKTNKLRTNTHIVSPVARRIQTYVELNKHRLRDGWLFPSRKKFSKKKGEGAKTQPYYDSQSFSTWFSQVRKRIGKEHPSFLDHYPMSFSGKIHCRYRITPYSFRRFFETWFYVKNNYNLALLKEIMEYSSKFDPMKSYIRITHQSEERARYVEETFSPISSYLVDGQKQLGEFV